MSLGIGAVRYSHQDGSTTERASVCASFYTKFRSIVARQIPLQDSLYIYMNIHYTLEYVRGIFINIALIAVVFIALLPCIYKKHICAR